MSQFARKNGLISESMPYSELDVETRVKVLRVILGLYVNVSYVAYSCQACLFFFFRACSWLVRTSLSSMLASGRS